MVMGQEERKNKAKLEKTQIQLASNSSDYEAAVKILRSADADALTPADATPHRDLLFRIHVDEVVGKGAKPGGS